jgi:hypothetical protein
MARSDPAPAELPALTRSDAWLLAALAEGSYRGRYLTLQQLIEHADWLNRAIPTFDEISFGFPRLVAHGLMTVDGMSFRATPRAIALRKAIRAGTLGGVLMEMDKQIGARPYPEPEVEDRTLGRFPGLTSADLDAAVQRYSQSFDRWLARISVAVKAAAFVSLLLAAKQAVARLSGRRRS